jgi:hypothetical protein
VSTDTDERGTVTEHFLLTRADVEALFTAGRLRGVSLYAAVTSDAPIVDEGGARTGKHFPGACHASIRLSVAQAMVVARSMLTEGLEARGARLPVRRYTWAPKPGAKRGHVSIYLGG